MQFNSDLPDIKTHKMGFYSTQVIKQVPPMRRVEAANVQELLKHGAFDKDMLRFKKNFANEKHEGGVHVTKT